ncbi:MAG: PglZ domain-containing protein [Deltaproteobacteria bacterium]|nr:PglZ domain-containing protein [Deltaproteobacteria bacterium]
MTIQDFISDHFLRRLKKTMALVVYDPERRYHSIVMNLAGDDCQVIEGSASTITGREQALELWRGLVRDPQKPQFLLIYLPIAKPQTDEERQQDPYQIFAIGGGEFPQDDGDEYRALCHKAAPELAGQIENLFKTGTTDFDTVNTLLSGRANWPKLRTLLKVESTAEILVALVSPTSKQREALEKDTTWVAECRDFTRTALGLELKTRSEKWPKISDELWRYVLFSELAQDLPVALPAALLDVPHAPTTYKDLIFTVCETLRTSEKHQQVYIEKANQLAAELQLDQRFKNFEQLGERDTFAFQEQQYLKAFVNPALMDNAEGALRVMEDRQRSIWVKHTPERQLLWTIAALALQLNQKIKTLKGNWQDKARSLDQLVTFYAGEMRQADRRHRELERAVTETYGELADLGALVDLARQHYIQFLEEVQAAFMQLVEKEGWPVSGELRHTQVFDKFVTPWMQERRKTAYFMVDSLRYELGAELEKELSGDFKTELQTVCAQVPTLTSVGMAALMPGADGNIRLVNEGGNLVPYVSGKKVLVPTDRLDYLRGHYGDRVDMIDLDQLITKKSLKWSDTVDLLLVRTTDIDLLGENKPLETFRVFPDLLGKIVAGLKKLHRLGFDRAVIVTDHGFLLLSERQYGDSIGKPPGDWQVVKDRCLLGAGSGNAGIVAFPKADVGIRGDFENYAVPLTFATFVKGRLYCHGGLSLQEAVVPLIVVDMATIEKEHSRAEVKLKYKGKTSGAINIRMPMIEVSVTQRGIFEEEMEVALAAYDKKKVVGEVIPGQHVNPATNRVKIRSGESLKVPLRMDEDFQGAFEVKATDPETGVILDSIKLRTDYLE